MVSQSSQVDLTGQVALVTGGGRGIGRAYAQGLAVSGASVAVTARTESQLAETVKLIEQDGGKAIAVAADVTDRAAVEHLVAVVQNQLGPIDILVNNAAVASPTGVDWEIDPDEWWRTVEINLRGPLLCSHAVLQSMIPRRKGRIINLSSGAAYSHIPFMGAYCASKAALTHWTRCLADDLKEHGISVFALTPGAVMTSMTEYLASDEVPQGLRDVARFLLDENNQTPIDESVGEFLLVASGAADSLSGRCLWVRDGITNLAEHTDEIIRDGLYILDSKRLP